MSNHTPTPWHIVRNLQEQRYDSAAPYTHELWTADGEQPVCKLVDDVDAEFVNRAVNAHEDLLAALKELSVEVPGPGAVERGKRAIAKAEGK